MGEDIITSYLLIIFGCIVIRVTGPCAIKKCFDYEIRAARELPSREVERAKGSILDII
jgi:hypothetical protein